MKAFTMPHPGAVCLSADRSARSIDLACSSDKAAESRPSATSNRMLRVEYHSALVEAHNALVALAQASSLALETITRELRGEKPACAYSVGVNADMADMVRDGARALAGAAINLIWKQQPLAGELENVLTIYELAGDYQRLADDLATLADEVLGTDEFTLHAAPPHLRELADTALSALSHVHEGLRDRTAAPLLRAHTERLRADILATDGVAELQQLLFDRYMVTEHACSLLVIVIVLQRIARQAATLARRSRKCLAETA
jgi:phosphate transport system protein